MASYEEFIVVPKSMIDECSDFRGSLRLCLRLSGLPLKIVADALGMTEKSLSRILLSDRESVRYFPENLLVQLMRTCRNLAPVQWLSAQVGGLFIAGGQKNFAEALVKEIVKGSKGLRFHRVQTLMEAAGIRG